MSCITPALPSLATNHELIKVCRDAGTGLHAIIAVHNTVLGPALGGLSMRHCPSTEKAILEVLLQSRSMTLKSAAAGLDFGGGQALIIGNPGTQKTPELLRRFGEFVNDLDGKFLAIGDAAIGAEDIGIIREVTPHAACLDHRSEFTALGVFVSIQAAVERLTGSEELHGIRVLVQGAGRVGLALIKHLRHAGAVVYACDVRESALRAAVVAGARAISTSVVQAQPVDVYAPCAMGGVLNPAAIPQLRCDIVAGAAHHQLLDEERDGQALHDRGILYVPDFIANAGGLIQFSVERSGFYSHERALQLTRDIRGTVKRIFTECDIHRLHPHQAALRQAEERLRYTNVAHQAA